MAQYASNQNWCRPRERGRRRGHNPAIPTRQSGRPDELGDRAHPASSATQLATPRSPPTLTGRPRPTRTTTVRSTPWTAGTRLAWPGSPSPPPSRSPAAKARHDPSLTGVRWTAPTVTYTMGFQLSAASCRSLRRVCPNSCGVLSSSSR